jgi:two-component system OmpR family response regulator
MNFSLTKERPVNQKKLAKARERFLSAIESVAAGKPIVTPPIVHTDDQSLRVLIVDDHRATTDTMSALVKIWGHDVRHAYDGATGLALAAAFRPDVLLIDMLMANLNGFEVARQVRRQNRLDHCFIVAVTGRTDAKHRSQCYEAGVDLFLIKPVAPPDMQTLLTLDVKRKRRLSTRMTTGIPCGEFAATC